jgi:hypothetical protein
MYVTNSTIKMLYYSGQSYFSNARSWGSDCSSYIDLAVSLSIRYQPAEVRHAGV